MINFEDEIEKFQPSLEIEQAEDVIYNNDMTDISDILKELLKERDNTHYDERSQVGIIYGMPKLPKQYIRQENTL